MKKYHALNSIELATIVASADGEIPEWTELIPAGQVTGRDGRSWNNSDPSSILAAFAASGADLPVDLEHSTELKAPQGEPAPAAGWVKELQNRDGAVWGRIDWTDNGRELVASKSYRYLSPVIVYQRDNGLIVGLSSVGLTNRPNLRLPALNQQLDNQLTEEAMDLKQLLAVLGMSETATFAEALNRITAMKGDLATALNRADNPALDKFVPRADHDAVLARATNAEQALADLKKTGLEQEIETAINAALKDGKITPATADYHRAQCRQEGGLKLFADFVQAAPVLGDPSGLDGKKADTGTALNAEERQLCQAMGVSEEDFLKTKKGAQA